MAGKKENPSGQVAYTNARLLDPASGLDAMGGLITNAETIAEVGADLFKKGASKSARSVDCQGKCLAPGLVDMRVEIGDLAATAAAAVSGGVTSMVCGRASWGWSRSISTAP